jgi:hypothetical protein
MAIVWAFRTALVEQADGSVTEDMLAACDDAGISIDVSNVGVNAPTEFAAQLAPAP